MTLTKEKLVNLHFKIGEGLLELMDKHAAMRHVSRTSFIVTTLVDHLQTLEEKHAYLESMKKGRKQSSPIPQATGMQIEIKTPAAPLPTDTKKTNLDRSFARYSDFIENADNHIDRSIRVQTCYDDLKLRAKTPEEADEAFVRLQQLLELRKDIKKEPIQTLPVGVPIEGDTEE